ncbi:hypothetical protein V3F56_03490 [Moorellaceae bacterium AZ2]
MTTLDTFVAAIAIASTVEHIRAIYAENLNINPKPAVPCPVCDTPLQYAVEIIELLVSFRCPACGLTVINL